MNHDFSGPVPQSGSYVPLQSHLASPSSNQPQFAEISNLSTHLTLRALRPAGTRKRAIPYGYGFSSISYPNYFFESVAWLTICCMTNSVAGEF